MILNLFRQHPYLLSALLSSFLSLFSFWTNGTLFYSSYSFVCMTDLKKLFHGFIAVSFHITLPVCVSLSSVPPNKNHIKLVWYTYCSIFSFFSFWGVFLLHFSLLLTSYYLSITFKRLIVKSRFENTTTFQCSTKYFLQLFCSECLAFYHSTDKEFWINYKMSCVFRSSFLSSVLKQNF